MISGNIDRITKLVICRIDTIRLYHAGEEIDIDHAVDILVTDSLTPLCDAARALLARGITGRLEMWDGERSFPRMTGDIAKLARLTIEETETTGPRVRRWRPFAAGTGRPISADRLSRLPDIAPDKAAAGGAGVRL